MAATTKTLKSGKVVTLQTAIASGRCAIGGCNIVIRRDDEIYATADWQVKIHAFHFAKPAAAPATTTTAPKVFSRDGHSIRCADCGTTGTPGLVPFTTNPAIGLCDDCC